MTSTREALMSALINELKTLCREALQQITLAPSIEIRDVEVDVIDSPRFGSEAPRRSYVVRICTNDAAMVRGAVAAFKGAYKERIEAILNHEVTQAEPEATAYVEIEGPEMGTVDRLIGVQSFIQNKKLSSSSPIVRTAARYNIGYIQIRGRHLIAPSPAIAEFLENYAARNVNSIRSAIDLFAGTGIASKVLLRIARPEHMVLIENDPQKIRAIRRHIKENQVEIRETDALGFSFNQHYDLAIADPYYEDVHSFLTAQLENLRSFVNVFLLVPGNIEDRLWNDSVLSRLEEANYNVIPHQLYGQVIFEVRKIT